jgi:endonuclease YncB( thermonuclease family)
LKFKLFSKKGVFFRKDAFFIGRGLLVAAVVVLAVLVCGSGYAGSECTTPAIDKTVRMQSVVDGDTIRLSDKKLVRLIGINSPEIGYDGADSQPLARAAREFLQSQLDQRRRVALVYGKENQDRHGRYLAHVFVADGDSYRNVQQLLLENGLAFWVAIAPNTRFLNCYQSAEAKAAKARLGVWREAYFQPKNAADKDALTPGFQLLQGKITVTFKTEKFFWLKFNDSVALRIARKYLHNFDQSELTALEGKTVIARGWAFKHKHRLTMQISHRAAISVQR